MEQYDRWRRAKYFPSLDGLRGISIIAVVWFHSTGHRPGILGKGALGVDLFFAISGLLITTLLLRELDRTGDVSLRGFYIRRSLRIFPLYYAVLAAYALLVLAVERRTPAGREFLANLPAFLTYTSNWFVDLGPRVIFYFAWSLATEEQFYLVWPSIVRFARGRWAAVGAMSAMLIAGEAARWAVAAGVVGREHLAARILSSIAAPICLGSLGAFLLHRRPGFELAARVLGRPWSAPAAAAALVVVLAVDGAPPILVALAMAALVIASAIRCDHGLRRVLELRPLVYVGTVSYGVYLLHMLALNAVRRALPGHAGSVHFLVTLPLVLAMASVSFRVFEARFLRLKDRFTAARPEAAAADRKAA